RLLLKAGADPKVCLKYEGMGAAPREEMKLTLLHRAAMRGHVETAKLLLDAGVPVDVRAANDVTPLRIAAACGQPEMVRLLLENEARIHGVEGRAAMNVAEGQVRPTENEKQRQGNAHYRAVIRALNGRGVPIDLFSAIALGDAGRVKELLTARPALAGIE